MIAALLFALAAAAHPQHSHTHAPRAPAPGWSDRGCVQDSAAARVLDTLAYQGALNSPAHCTKLCGDNMYSFAGVENGQQCYCAREMKSTPASASDCTSPCPGDAGETCGGATSLHLFELVGAGAGTGASASGAASNAASSAATTASATAAAAAGAAPPAVSGTGDAVTQQAAVPASSATKYVWAHHMIGNTEFYTSANWTADVDLAKRAGIDGFALNMGRDAYQPQNVEWAYAAAGAAGLKCFFSFDMTSFPCMNASDVSAVAELAKKYAAHPAQAMYGGKVLVSTFSGERCTFGQASVAAGWDAVRRAIGTEIYFMPSTFMTTAQVKEGRWYDGQMHWDAAWPQGPEALTTQNDTEWIAALGTKGYMPPVSPFFFTYYGKDSWDKNWIYRSDDWLLATRFEQVIGMRDKVDMLELLSWNDFGESHYIAPVPAASAQPKSDGWTRGMPHTGLLSLVKHYATVFRTGAPPADEGLWLWTRPHPKDATPNAPSLPRPARADDTDDNLYAVAYLTSPARVRIWSGASSAAWDLQAGLAKLKVPSAAGAVGGEVTRDGKAVLRFDSGSWAYTDKPADYNFNYFVGEG
ncbi:hypothetical protein CC85DRAFT_242261 [Cutaneotrichosporon oleaginosum]|uniref:WSC domain-containing protein n=1 Tax=Cutaneotrichosporon oleaginosum TaxID=879819 RepID=A0A0J0XU34_9TREE|nr:uncharacterized protein CC85DRAFT_242261 [Cutaneotrichosporon oleaginosum]KLT44598.1 hypothetical protein CC85DRAFT_242261 [Cutaneotrichosporon oleaginosum]TXT13887.1 hypothetical protein COLE_00080 [Cutaneotrichosporon oleaginosum]